MSQSARKARHSTLAIAAIAAVMSLSACGGGGGTSGGTATESAAPTDGGVLRFGLETAPTTFIPSEVTESSAGIVENQMYETLFEFHDGKIVPNLATGMRTSRDGLTTTITLRKGISFSNGRPVTSADVIFSIDQARNSPFWAALYEPVSQLRPQTPTTVVVETTKPFPNLEALLAFQPTFVIPKGFSGMSEKEFDAKPIGTGPYMVTTAKRGGPIKLRQNPHFWKESKPHLEEIVFTVTTEETSRIQQIRSGQLEMTKGTVLTAKTSIPPGGGIRAEVTPQDEVNTLLLNQTNPLFKDQRVRRAINLAIDREGIVKTATDEKGQLGLSILPPLVPGWIDVKPPARNVAEAKRLVSEALGAGAHPSFTIDLYDFDGYSRLAGQIIQQDLAEIGFQVELQPLDEAALGEILPAGEYDAALTLYTSSLPAPFEAANAYVEFFAQGDGANLPALERLLRQAETERDETKRLELYAQFQELVIEEEDMLVINYQPTIYPVVENVGGVEFSGAAELLLRNAGFTN